MRKLILLRVITICNRLRILHLLHLSFKCKLVIDEALQASIEHFLSQLRVLCLSASLC